MRLAHQIAIVLILLQFASVPAEEPPQLDGDSIVAPLGQWLLQTVSDLKHEFTPAAGAEFVFKVVDTDGRPVADASVLPWAVGTNGGSFGVPGKKFPPVRTDAEGIARIVIPSGEDRELKNFKYLRKDDINEFALEVRHPDHPAWCKYLAADGKQVVVLGPSTTVEIRAHRRTDVDLVDQLFPMLSATTDFTDWSQDNGKLTLRRVDLAGDEPWRWLRIVHAPDQGSAWFSDLIDLKQEAGNPISLDVPLKPGVRVVGHLAEDVPRPIKNGRVVAKIVDGSKSWTNWEWQATAEIAPDGTFELNSLPRDENLQLIAICDGWVSRSPSIEEVNDYGEKYHYNLKYRGPNSVQVFPQLVRIGGLAANPDVRMDPTATCEVTVVDENKSPIANADVEFWPNEYFFGSGSSILGVGRNTIEEIRAELKSGKPEKPQFIRDSRYSAKTDANGKAIVANLPAWAAADAPPHETQFRVYHDGYLAIANSPNAQRNLILREPELVVKLAPEQTSRVTIQIRKLR